MLWIGLFLFFVLGVVLQALRNIPVTQKALVTFLGERNGKTKNEGWRMFWFYPFVCGYVLVDITKEDKDLLPTDVRTPDLAPIKVRGSITWQPDYSIDDDTGKTSLMEYIVAAGDGGKKGREKINDQLEDITYEAIRELAIDPNRPPNTWEEAIKMKREFAVEVVKKILGEDAPDDIINQLRRGNGKLKVKSLGVSISRLNITDVEPEGKVAVAAEEKAKEDQEARGEEKEIDTVNKLAKKLIDTLGISPELALEIVQTERGKVKKDISEKKINVPPEILAAGLKILSNLMKGGNQ